MKRLRQWTNRKLAGNQPNGGKKSNKNQDNIEDPALTTPKLPLSRPRALTLSHSDISQERSQFFTVLPREIRDNVYLALMGHRTIHIYLDYDHADRIGERHANLAGALFKDGSTPKQWRWWSCVCHRMRRSVRGELFVLDFWLDRCRWAEQTYCQWVFPDRSECLVGALGWLSSCRQAYSEGISVLYSTNTFHLGEHDGEPLLFRHVNSMFLPQRLASMKSLELKWKIENFGRKSTDRDTGKPVFETLLDILTSSFPNLTNVHIAVQTAEHVQDRPELSFQPGESLLSTVISPMDKMVACFGTQLQLCEFIVRWSYYKALREALGEGASVEKSFRSTSPRKFRRHVEDGNGELGYWVGYLPDIL